MNMLLTNDLPEKKKKLQRKPWITKDILNLIKQKKTYVYYKSHFQSNDCQEKAIYKKFSNKLTKLQKNKVSKIL